MSGRPNGTAAAVAESGAGGNPGAAMRAFFRARNLVVSMGVSLG